MRKYLYIFIFINITFGLSAQNVVQNEEHELTLATNPWLQITNAAGLGLSKTKSHGITELGYVSESGDYHRAQQGNELSGLNFYSERYDKLGKNWTSWGSFNFVMDREKNRAWSDVFSTYNSNPYIFGSGVSGSYDRQLFDFKIKMSSFEKGRLTYGFGLDYLVGDLSRLRDPRTRVFLADYAFLPAVVYRINRQQRVGLNLKAAYRKEKMPNVTAVNDNDFPKFYTFSGIENADAVAGGYVGFQRQFVSNVYGGELQYSLKTDRSELLISGGGDYEQQQILENMKQSPGSYEAMNYKARIVGNTVSKGRMYNLVFSGTLKTGSADENIQKLVSTNNESTGVNSQNWVTLFTYNNRYVNSAYAANLTFDIRDVNANKTDYAWLIGVEGGLSGFVNQYNLPYSQFAANRLNTSLYGHYRLLNKNNDRLTLNAKVGYSAGFNNKLQFSDGATDIPELGASTFKQGMYDVATNVYMPDLKYFDAAAYNASLEAKYSMPLNFKKAQMTGFIKAYYGQEITNSLGSWTSAGVSVGIITL